MAGLGHAEYTAKPVLSQLVFGVGSFCRTHATPAPPSVLDAVRRGEVNFSDAGDLQVIGGNGKVFWSAAGGLPTDESGAEGRTYGRGKSWWRRKEEGPPDDGKKKSRKGGPGRASGGGDVGDGEERDEGEAPNGWPFSRVFRRAW